MSTAGQVSMFWFLILVCLRGALGEGRGNPKEFIVSVETGESTDTKGSDERGNDYTEYYDDVCRCVKRKYYPPSTIPPYREGPTGRQDSWKGKISGSWSSSRRSLRSGCAFTGWGAWGSCHNHWEIREKTYTGTGCSGMQTERRSCRVRDHWREGGDLKSLGSDCALTEWGSWSRCEWHSDPVCNAESCKYHWQQRKKSIIEIHGCVNNWETG